MIMDVRMTTAYNIVTVVRRLGMLTEVRTVRRWA